VDRQVDEWSSDKPLSVKKLQTSCKFDTSDDGCTMVCTLVCVAVYRLLGGYQKDEMPRAGKMPLWTHGVPCIDAVDENTGWPITVMAGLFGVPEGAPLSEGDNEPAPAPMLSPDFTILTYSDLFKPGEGDKHERHDDEGPLYVGGERKIPLPAGS
jgi:hypothetical protein